MLSCRWLPELRADEPLGTTWEALVQAMPESGFMQGLAWAEFKRQQGLSVRHAGLFAGEDLVGGALAYGSQQSGGMIFVPEGPVLPWQDETLAGRGLHLLLELLAEDARRSGAIGVRIEPRLPAPKPALLKSFRPGPMELVPSQTLYVDLRPEPEAILAAMREKGRYNVRLAERRDVRVTESRDLADVGRFCAIMADTAERDGFFSEPASFFATLAATLVPSGQARMLFAGHEGDTLGAVLLMTYGKRATYLYGGVGNHKRNLMAGYALQWAAMTTARRLGCDTYDFYGFEPFGDPDHLYAGFSRFKRQFGGTPVRFVGPQDHHFLDSLADAVIRAVQEIG